MRDPRFARAATGARRVPVQLLHGAVLLRRRQVLDERHSEAQRQVIRLHAPHEDGNERRRTSVASASPPYNEYYDGDDERAIFRLTSNGWCNRLLKTTLRNAGINRRLTFHSARHTFATTVTLANGVPIEVVSRMLGHTDIKTTQIYAKVLQTSVSSEMQRISKNIDSYYDIPVRRSDCI